MRNGLILAIMLGLGAIAAAAQAQQANGSTPNRGLGSGTPGVAVGTTGTTYATPGADQKQPIPGGGIPMGAATQDTSNLSSEPSNFNNDGSSNRR
jgi:hypothetical protein